MVTYLNKILTTINKANLEKWSKVIDPLHKMVTSVNNKIFYMPKSSN